jgi:hypothetical protein
MADDEPKNRWLETYGKRVIVFAYETPGLSCIWLITAKGEGLAHITDTEWGPIEADELERQTRDASIPVMKRPKKIFKKLLPCTLAKLWEETEVSSYFSD